MDFIIMAQKCCLSLSPPGFSNPTAGMQHATALLCVLGGPAPETQARTRKAAVTQSTREGKPDVPIPPTEVSLSSGFVAL